MKRDLEQDRIRLHYLVNQVLHANLDMADSEPPIAQLAEGIIAFGIEEGASDIHLEPLKTGFRLRYRIDGTLWQWPEIFDLKAYDTLISRLKVMANMDTSSRHRPADGHIHYAYRDRKLDIRAASIPVKGGQSMVLRLMHTAGELRSLEDLGFSHRALADFKELIKKPAGLVIVSGPMNSGKSSTLYAALTFLNDPTRHIITVEDPVECVLPGINQMEVNLKADLTFASGLRAALRHDANCLMVGEIRDQETAKIAIRAALTGHLVLTTIHAEDSIATLFRLLDMEAPPYMLAATLSGIVAQRLVRKICPHCRRELTASELSAEINLLPPNMPRPNRLYIGDGCAACRHTGYLGRLALQENLLLTEPLREALLANADMLAMRSLARRKGLLTLEQDGIAKALAGITTLGEVRRVLYGSD